MDSKMMAMTTINHASFLPGLVTGTAALPGVAARHSARAYV